MIIYRNGHYYDTDKMGKGGIYKETDPTIPSWAKAEAKPSYTAQEIDDTNSPHKFVTEQEKATWNNKSDFSGSYNDLQDKPTKISDFANDSGQTLNTLQANEFHRTSNRSFTGSVNTYAMNGDGPYTMSNGSKYRVTVDDLDPEIVTSTMNGDNVRIESSQTITYDSREFPIWYFETNTTRALSMAIWHGSESQQVGAITKSHNILIEELTYPTIDSKYIASEFVNEAELNQSVANLQSSIETKLSITTFDSTAVSHFRNDKYYTSFIPTSPKVGDYLYSDGTISTDIISGKTAVAVALHHLGNLKIIKSTICWYKHIRCF